MHDISDTDVTQANIEFHRKVSGVYDESREQNHHKVIALYAKIFDDILSFFPSEKRLQVLDLGCGTGFLENFVDPHVHTVLGLDACEEMLEVARKKFPGVEYRVADLNQFEPDHQFDLVMMNSLLHHIKDYRKIVRNAARWTRPGGALFIGNEPNFYCYKYLAALKWVFRTIVDRRPVRADNRDLEQITEYHLYQGHGFLVGEMERQLKAQGFRQTRAIYSARELFGGLKDRTGLPLVDCVPGWVMDAFGPLSRNWYMYGVR